MDNSREVWTSRLFHIDAARSRRPGPRLARDPGADARASRHCRCRSPRGGERAPRPRHFLRGNSMGPKAWGPGSRVPIFRKILRWCGVRADFQISPTLSNYQRPTRSFGLGRRRFRGLCAVVRDRQRGPAGLLSSRPPPLRVFEANLHRLAFGRGLTLDDLARDARFIAESFASARRHHLLRRRHRRLQQRSPRITGCRPRVDQVASLSRLVGLGRASRLPRADVGACQRLRSSAVAKWMALPAKRCSTGGAPAFTVSGSRSERPDTAAIRRFRG